VRRREFIALLSGAAVGWPAVSIAQQAAKVNRIGYLGSNMAVGHLREAFRQGRRDLGYIEGRDVVIEYRDAEGKLEPLPALAAELVALKVDVIVAGSSPAALAAKQSFPSSSDPVAIGLVSSLARPGGNVTGFSFLCCPGLLNTHEALDETARVHHLA
jgi:ABC-type uncharacterized transport system substrate-binding protein